MIVEDDTLVEDDSCFVCREYYGVHDKKGTMDWDGSNVGEIDKPTATSGVVGNVVDGTNMDVDEGGSF